MANLITSCPTSVSRLHVFANRTFSVVLAEAEQVDFRSITILVVYREAQFASIVSCLQCTKLADPRLSHIEMVAGPAHIHMLICLAHTGRQFRLGVGVTLDVVSGQLLVLISSSICSCAKGAILVPGSK